MLTSTPAFAGIGAANANAKRIVPKSNFFMSLPPLVLLPADLDRIGSTVGKLHCSPFILTGAARSLPLRMNIIDPFGSTRVHRVGNMGRIGNDRKGSGSYPCTVRPNSRMKSISSGERGPFSSAARFSRNSTTLRGPVSATSMCGLVRQKR